VICKSAISNPKSEIPMGHEPAELETRIARCERAIFGDDDSREGLSARMHMTETTLSKIDATLSRVTWLMITGIIVGILNLVITRPGTHAPSQSTSVITGDASDLSQLATHRTYLTTADVAAKEKVSVREVIDMIAQGEIEPAPEKTGREYRIAANYRILPQSAASCGTEDE
jgi:hypothetical protein